MKKKVAARICAFALTASLTAVDIPPAFAATASEELAVDGMPVTEEDVLDDAVVSIVETGEENIPAIGEEQETETDSTEKDDGLIYVNDALYSGCYMDDNGIFYVVANGVPELKTGTVDAGETYYSCSAKGMQTLPSQTVFVAGKAYTGYYMDNASILYTVSNGTAEPETGTVNAGTAYYSAQAKETQTLPSQTVFVAGEVYTGYYMDSAGILYIITGGTAKAVNGAVSKGIKYYNCDNAGILTPMTLSRQTIFVEGKIYKGYYKDTDGKMYTVTAGIRELKTGTVGKGSKYYNCKTKKTQTLSKQTLYIKGEIYSGYYMNSANKMYHVKKGTLTLKTGTVKKGTKYYNYKTKKTKTLSGQTLYVKGKVYTGYYMDSKNRVYSVKKGTRTLKTGVVKKGAKYYSYKAEKTKKLSQETLYVKGKAYNGYYMDNQNIMYGVKKGALTLVTGALGKETKYYSYQSNQTEKLSGDVLYVDGKVYSGYCLGNDNKMYTVTNDTCTPVNTMLGAQTAYYDGNENKMMTLPGPMIYVYGKAMDGMTVEQMQTLQKAQAVVQSVSVPTDTMEQKLYKCYLWMEKFPYIQYRTMEAARVSYPDNWDVVFANDIFDKHGGCCASEACAFAYMAKACGYERPTICSDTKHAWVDIDGRLYDPLFAESKSFSANYNAVYTDYRIRSAYSKTL